MDRGHATVCQKENNESTSYIHKNTFIAAFCIPIGFTLGNIGGMAIGGAVAGIVASIMERYEIGPIDDNILITLSSSVVLFLFSFFI